MYVVQVYGVHVSWCKHSSHMYGVHVRCFKHAENNAHVRRTQSSHMCGVHVRRTCTPYMYHSINTPLCVLLRNNLQGKVGANHCWSLVSKQLTTAVMLLLTVILTDVRQLSGPKCLINVSLSVKVVCRITKSDSSRPGVAVMLSTK